MVRMAHPGASVPASPFKLPEISALIGSSLRPSFMTNILCHLCGYDLEGDILTIPAMTDDQGDQTWFFNSI